MKLIYWIYSLFLSLRYKVDIKGIEHIKNNNPLLIIPNHPGIIDPQLLISNLGKHKYISPVMTETYYNIPVLKYFFKLIGAISVPDLQKGSTNQQGTKEIFENIVKALSKGKNIIIYPSGQTYSQGFEKIIGKKSVYNIVSNLPKGTKIIGVRTNGLWGSIWTKAWTGNSINFFTTYIKSIFIVLLNFIIFVPKRKVSIEIVDLTSQLVDENYQIIEKDLNKFNQYLEDFYNKNGKEEINYISHYFYYNDGNHRQKPAIIQGSLESITGNINTSEIIPQEIQTDLIKKISDIKNIDTNTINLNSNLILDLFFDSLDLAEIKSYIQLNFKGASNPPITDLKNVYDLCIMAIGKSKSQEQLKNCKWIDYKETKLLSEMILNYPQYLDYGSKGKEAPTIIELVKENFKNDKNIPIIYDNIFGTQTKNEFLIKAYLISDYIKKIDGKYIGIMLPSLSSTSILIIATYLAGKIPVMLNWTLGEAAFDHCINFANIQTILTSENFFNKIATPGVEKYKDKMLFLERMLKNISIFKKIKALINSRLFIIPKLDEQAVILFTSGSESLPKAVSLSHKNIIEDIVGALNIVKVTNNDILLGFLPPFHSFGFTVNTILPLISGIRVAYTPDPNDSQTILGLIKHTKATFLTSTPTFLKMIIRLCKEGELDTIKYAVTGAEKCPEDLFYNFKKYAPNGLILEGYGITECSPVISINPTQMQKLGSVGLAIGGLDIKILSLENEVEVGKNQQGMIFVSGPSIFNGYLDKSLENPFKEIYGKNYYKTGDLGYIDEEGYLFITGRLKRFIKIAGEMISLPFVEGILNKKYGNDIAIEALEKNGDAKITLFSTLDINLEEANSFLRSQGVSNLIKLSNFQKIETIPVLGTGKIDYKELKKMIT